MGRVPQLSLRAFALAGALVACSGILPACSGVPLNDNDARTTDDRHASAWDAVTSAADAPAQRAALDVFLALERPAGTRPLQVDVYRIDSGARAAIGQELWDHPYDHEVELRLAGREYRFVPLSRASLEPLFRE